jgi:hypothetical protein
LKTQHKELQQICMSGALVEIVVPVFELPNSTQAPSLISIIFYPCFAFPSLDWNEAVSHFNIFSLLGLMNDSFLNNFLLLLPKN